MIKIIADSSCDMNHIEGVNFTCVPLTISTDDKSFIDDETLNVAELLETLAIIKVVLIQRVQVLIPGLKHLKAGMKYTLLQ